MDGRNGIPAITISKTREIAGLISPVRLEDDLDGGGGKGPPPLI